VQGGAADILKKALAMLPKELEGTESRINSTVHDEIIVEAPVDKAQEVAQILKGTMESAGRYYLKKVPVEIDVSLADSWAEK
jgi:DNA polymerase-1